MNNEDRTFRVKMLSAQARPVKVKLYKVGSVVDVKGEFDNKPSKNIYTMIKQSTITEKE